MKKYFHIRICKGCNEQRMVDKNGYCSQCNRAADKFRTRHKNTPVI